MEFLIIATIIINLIALAVILHRTTQRLKTDSFGGFIKSFLPINALELVIDIIFLPAYLTTIVSISVIVLLLFVIISIVVFIEGLELKEFHYGKKQEQTSSPSIIEVKDK
jgi:hypothetical protein